LNFITTCPIALPRWRDYRRRTSVSNIVVRLRNTADFIAKKTGADNSKWVREAADEIERLQDAKRRALAIADERAKENVRLRTERDALVKAFEALRDDVSVPAWIRTFAAGCLPDPVSTPPGGGK
jgi:hypothetical protein